MPLLEVNPLLRLSRAKTFLNKTKRHFYNMAYWLFKTEPDAFSIDDLANRPEQTEPWDGVRNVTVHQGPIDRQL